MPKVYLCAYHSNLHKAKLHSDPAHVVAQAYAMAIRRSDVWPYDFGDDPSFFSATHLNGPVTWGVCRGDIRNKLASGDVVVFFAYDDLSDHTVYKLSAIVTVQRVVSENQLFLEPKLARFKNYLNLLVIPTSDRAGWQHMEPCFPKAGHDDWLWRLADRSTFNSGDFGKRAKKIKAIKDGQRFNGKYYRFGPNYAIFSNKKAETHVLPHPQVVAEHWGGDSEIWKNSLFSKGVRKRTLDKGITCDMEERGLRLPKAYPHCPPPSWEMSPKALTAWRAKFISFVQQQARSSTNRKVLATTGVRQRRGPC